MMAVIRFLSEPFWQQLGLTLLHFLWQGLVVALGVATAVHLFRLNHGHGRYSAYLLAFALMAACPLLTFLVIGTPAETGAIPGEPMVAAADTSGTMDMPQAPPVGDAVIAPASGVETARVEVVSEPTTNHLQKWLPWAVGFWMLGVTVLSLRLLLGYIGIQRWRRCAQPLPQELTQRIGRLAQKLGLPKFSRIFLCPAISEATAIGYLRPMVLLPAAMLTQMDPAMIEAVVAHELAHIRRLDLWVNLTQRIVETLLFYHPAVWWLSNRLRAEREFCCDEMAVEATGERLAYASALETAQRERLTAAQPALALGLGQSRRPTLSRVRHILGLPQAPSDSRFWLAGAIVVAILAVLAMPAVSLMSARADTEIVNDSETLMLGLFEAAEAGDLDRVKTLLAGGTDVNAHDRANRTALHYAAQQGHLEVARLLIARGADVNAVAQAGLTPLFAAVAEKGHAQIAELLLEHQAHVDDTEAAGYTPLYYAIWADDQETVKTLLAHGADGNKTPRGDYSPLVYAIWQWHTGNIKALMDAGADINVKDGDGRTPLYWAVDEGVPEVIRLLMDAGVQMSDIHRAVLEGDLAQVKRLLGNGTNVDTRDDIDRPLSHWALAAGQMEVFDYLLNNGADVTAATKDGSTLLHKASAKGLADVVKALIAKGAAVNARTKRGETPLFAAAGRGHKEVCQLLVANGADVNAALNNGRHPLGDATLRGHEEVVKLLLANGADVNLSVNNYGVALQAAACYGHPALVDILLAAGADVNANTRNGTPLHLAFRAAKRIDDETVGQIAKKLLDHGANVNATDKQSGCTPLHVAAQRGRAEAARLLLAAGADVNAKDNQGRTPLSYAEGRYQCRKVAELLRAHGARNEDTGSTAETNKPTPEALARAAVAGDLSKVKELITRGADVNGRNGTDRWTPLLAAADGGHEQTVRLLLSNGADPNKGDSFGFTPLHRALFVDDVETVEALIEGGADVNKRPNREDDPPLFYAVWQCHGAVKPLIDAGADVNAKGVQNGWTPLRHALQWAHADVVKQFVGRGIEIPAVQNAILEGDLPKLRQMIESGTDVDTKDEFGWTLTYWALSAGHKNVAEYLLGQGVDISARTQVGGTLLHQAVRAGFADIVKELIAKGADVDATTTDGRHPLGEAAGYGHAGIVELLLPKTANINATWSNGRCALADAALNGHKDVVELLLAHGAKVNLHEGGRGTALHAAARTGRTPIVDLLIAHGADVNLRAQNGTPLHRAVSCTPQVDENTCAEIVDKLIEAGADVNAKEPRQGDTPLHLAARRRHVQAAARLIRAGADPGAKNKDGKTPTDLAREQGLAKAS